MDSRLECESESNESNGKGILKKIVVGYVFPQKKSKLMPFLYEQVDAIEFRPIDFTKPLEEQGPFHILLHKLSHDMVFSRENQDALSRLQRFEEFVRSSGLPLIDPLESVRGLTDRGRICYSLQKLSIDEPLIRSPTFLLVDENVTDIKGFVSQSSLQYPMICKSTDACATEKSHFMTVVMNDGHLGSLSAPFVLQEFVNHGGRLYKAYVLGEDVYIYERESLPNIHSDKACSIIFDTQKSYPTSKDIHGESADAETAVLTTDCDTSKAEIYEKIRSIARILRVESTLSLFGFDIIQDARTGELLIVDMNYFPSYTEIVDFPVRLRKHIRKVYEESYRSGKSMFTFNS